MPQDVPVVVANRIAWFPRGVMTAFDAMLLLMTWVVIRDVSAGTLRPLNLAALVPFWIGGALATRWAFRQETVRVEVRGGRLRVTRHAGLAYTRTEHPAGDVLALAVREDRDGDGDPYYRGVLSVADHGEVVVREGHRREEVERDLERLRAALGSPPRP